MQIRTVNQGVEKVKSRFTLEEMESFVTAFKRIGLDAKVISSLSKSSKKASKCILCI